MAIRRTYALCHRAAQSFSAPATAPGDRAWPALRPCPIGSRKPSGHHEVGPAGRGQYIDGAEADYRKLCDALGLPELKEDPRFVTRRLLADNLDLLVPLLEEKISN